MISVCPLTAIYYGLIGLASDVRPHRCRVFITPQRYSVPRAVIPISQSLVGTVTVPALCRPSLDRCQHGRQSSAIGRVQRWRRHRCRQISRRVIADNLFSCRHVACILLLSADAIIALPSRYRSFESSPGKPLCGCGLDRAPVEDGKPKPDAPRTETLQDIKT
jgi:hypothetical protein